MKLKFCALILFYFFLLSCKKENLPPIVFFLSPTSHNVDFLVGDTIHVSVDAKDKDGGIKEIRFYIDELGVFSAKDFPYNYYWETELVKAGKHTIKVIAIDDDNLEGSASLDILISTTLPTVNTQAAQNVTYNSANLSFQLTNDGGSGIIHAGICWSKFSNPTTEDEKFSISNPELGIYTHYISELEPNTTYYFKAFATNNNGTIYGDQIEFKTSSIEIDFKKSVIYASYNSDNIYLLDNNNNLFVSQNNAESWEFKSRLGFSNKFQLEIFKNKIYACNGFTIYYSEDQGKTWESIPDFNESDHIQSFTINFNTNEIYATTLYALFRYFNGNWSRIFTTTSDNSSECVAIDQNNNIYYCTYLFTMFKSDDGGTNWNKFKYSEMDSNLWSTTGSMYITDNNVVLGNTWWTGVWKFTENNFIHLNKGFPVETHIGARNTVTRNSDYYTLINDTGGVLGIYHSADYGNNWENYNLNLTRYEFRNGIFMAINNSGKVFISVNGYGCYILNKELRKWEQIK